MPVIGFLRWFLGTAWKVLRHPVRFFRDLPESGYREPLQFLAAALILDALFGGLLSMLDWEMPVTPGMTRKTELWLNGMGLTLTPLLLFGTARLFGGRGRFRDAIAVVAYACATAILPSISYAGYAVGFYGLLLLFVGAKERFQLRPRRAVFMFLTLALVLSLGQVGLLFLALQITGRWPAVKAFLF